MCGIVGFLTSKAADVPDHEVLRAMRDTPGPSRAR